MSPCLTTENKVKVGRIIPIRKNAEAVIALKNEELEATGMSPQDIFVCADQENRFTVKDQLEDLKYHPRRYLGAFATRYAFIDKLLGVLELDEWSADDQLVFEEENERMRLIQNPSYPHLEGRPFGVFNLLAKDGNEEVYTELMDSAVERIKGKDTYISLRENHPARELLEAKYNFRPEGEKYGRPVVGEDRAGCPISVFEPQQLYARRIRHYQGIR